MRSLVGRIERLSADLDKVEAVATVRERYKDTRPAVKEGGQPSLHELCRQLGYLRQIAQEIVEAPPHKISKKGRPVLDHAVGSFMALFEDLTGERVRTGIDPGRGGDFLAGHAGAALRRFSTRSIRR
jgi:hypothetical protein